MVRLLAQTTRPEPANASASEGLGTEGPSAPEAPGTEGLEVPFAPAKPQTAPLANQAILISRVLDWGERRRLPLGLLFSVLIGVTAFAAYRSQLDQDRVQTGPTAAEDVNHQIGPLAAAVEGLTTADGSETVPDGVAPGDDGKVVVAGSDPAASDETPPLSQVPTSRPGSTDSPPGSSPRPTSSDHSSPGSERPKPPTTAKPKTTTAKPPTTAKPTTAPPTTAPPTTAPPTTAPKQPVTIGGRVDPVGTSGVAGIKVALYHDRDSDGVGDSLDTTVGASSDGNFSFSREPGCYVVRVVPPSGYEAVAGRAERSVCLSSGQQRGDLDLAIVATIAAPHGCAIHMTRSWWAGVEIQEPSREFAASYLFYSESGTQLYDTASFGSPDFTWGHNGSIKWTSNRNGFEESDVYSVAAKGSQGQVSAPTTCGRQFLH